LTAQEGRAMSAEFHAVVPSDRLLGAERAREAELLLAGARPDPLEPALAVQVATAQVLLALYWEMRYQRPGAGADVVINGGPLNGYARGRHDSRPRATEPGA
jgi:hypothetical protein